MTPATLRYWEKMFPVLSPQKTRGGQREYSEDDLNFLGKIIGLLKVEGRSLKGAQAFLDGSLPIEASHLAGELLVEVRKALQIMEKTDAEIGA